MLRRFISRWITATTADVGAEIEEKAKRAGLWALAGFLMAVAAAFVTALVYAELVAIYGTPIALGAIGAGFAALAAGVMLWAVYLARQDAQSATATGKASAAPESGARDPNAPQAGLQASLDDLVSMLGTAGMSKEALGLMAAKSALGEIKPLQLVALGLAAGFIVGRK